MERKVKHTLGELIDLLTIAEMKHAKIPEHKAEYAEHIEDLVHDINLLLPKPSPITAEFLRDVILLAQFNAHIWYNEGDIRNLIKDDKDLTDKELIMIARKLILTHSINGIRNTAKNRATKVIGGRLDYKIDSLASSAEHWRPAGY